MKRSGVCILLCLASCGGAPPTKAVCGKGLPEPAVRPSAHETARHLSAVVHAFQRSTGFHRLEGGSLERALAQTDAVRALIVFLGPNLPPGAAEVLDAYLAFSVHCWAGGPVEAARDAFRLRRAGIALGFRHEPAEVVRTFHLLNKTGFGNLCPALESVWSSF